MCLCVPGGWGARGPLEAAEPGGVLGLVCQGCLGGWEPWELTCKDFIGPCEQAETFMPGSSQVAASFFDSLRKLVPNALCYIEFSGPKLVQSRYSPQNWEPIYVFLKKAFKYGNQYMYTFIFS